MPDSKSNSGISKYMQQALKEMKNHILTLYSQEDFLRKLEEINESQSDFDSLKNELLQMFMARNFPAEEIQTLEKAAKNNFDCQHFENLIRELVPTKNELIVDLLKGIYKICKKFPREEKFLRRIVKRLADKYFRETDSSRMQILKRFVRHTNYHTKVIELRVLESVSDDEKAEYEKYSAEKKKDFLIRRLTEDIFTPLDVKPADYLAFFNGWVSKNNRWKKYFTLTPFTIPDGTAVDKTLEQNFVEYLSQYNLVKNGAIVCRRDELYKKNKIAFIKDQCGIFEALKNYKLATLATADISEDEKKEILKDADKISKGIGNFCDWTLKEYAAFLVALIEYKTPTNNNWLSDDLHKKLHEKLVKLVKNLIKKDFVLELKKDPNIMMDIMDKVEAEIEREYHNLVDNETNYRLNQPYDENLKSEYDKRFKAKLKAKLNERIENNDDYKTAIKDISKSLTPVELLNKILNLKNQLPNTKTTRNIFENIESAFYNLDTNHFKKFKIYWIKLFYEEKFNVNFKEIIFGACGLTVEDFEKFLKEEINSNNLIPYDLLNVLTDDSNSDTLIAYLTANNLTVNELHSKVVSYLKQIRQPGNKEYSTVGHAFERAFKDAKKKWLYLDHTLMKIADDLASAKFDMYGGTKKALYLFAFAFNMGFNTGTNTVDKERDIVQNLFQDFYTDNFLRYKKPPTGEGINFKNFVEVIYLYFLNKTDLTPAEKLDAAEKFIDDVFRGAKEAKVTFEVLPLSSSVYRANFFDYLDKDENTFKKYLLKNYKIYSKDLTENNNRIMLASEMRTVKRVFQELVDRMQDVFLDPAPNYKKTLTELQDELKNDELTKILADEGFVKILENMETTLNVQKRILRDRPKFFDATRYTRSDLIALYYCYFCNFLLDDFMENHTAVNWDELMDKFLSAEETIDEPSGLDIYLDKCGFANFSPKILYDNFIIFFLYLEIFSRNNAPDNEQ